MKSSYPSCKVGRCDWVVIRNKPKNTYKPKNYINESRKYSDREILEVRWCYEYDRWSADEISEVSGIPVHYVRNIVYYKTRANLSPKRDDFISFK